LLRSGVGPAGDLAALGIPVVADLPVAVIMLAERIYQRVYANDPRETAVSAGDDTAARPQSHAS
jgi:choline dehydrogenase